MVRTRLQDQLLPSSDVVKPEEKAAIPGKRRKRTSEEGMQETRSKKKKQTVSDGESASLPTQLSNGTQCNEELKLQGGVEDGAKDADGAAQKIKTQQIPIEPIKKRLGKKGDSASEAGQSRILQAESISKEEALRVNGGTTAKASVHKRFGDVGEVLDRHMPINEVDTNQASNFGQTSIEDESEDDAPETVAASTGLQQARTAEAGAVRAREIQDFAAKEKRQRREARLKKQAESSKRQQRPFPSNSQPSDPSAEPLKTGNFIPKIDSINGDNIPDYLPEELLAAEPMVRLPTPPPLIPMKIQTTKHKFVEPKTKPPKDVKHGAVTIRVLENNKSILPPKSSQSSKSLRESWLTGNRGRNKNIASKRRKAGGGFLRICP
ncbi:MAG: hypothetical protein MMC33_002000 [Icmadophila ericetorum]|nr:hypothetical protein [Icmadophila ericetorum]